MTPMAASPHAPTTQPMATPWMADDDAHRQA
jgi:hypothetical protein